MVLLTNMLSLTYSILYIIMSILIIVESPSKAKTINKYLGDEYNVISSTGHIRDLPTNEQKAIDIENGFKPNYITIKGKEKIIKEIINNVEKSDSVLIATDPDREGEAIAWHIKEVAKIKNAKRIVFNEITKEAILEAIKNPREISNELKEAQEGRRIIDRLFGYKLSALIWKKVKYGLSAGRVQTPTLIILNKRENEIKKFISKKYFEIKLNLNNKNTNLLAECEDIFENEIEVNNIIKNSSKKEFVIKSITKKESIKNPKPPFTTSTLQQAASNIFGYSPSNTMRIAQKLYEAGYITYIRTDSVNMASTFKDSLEKFIKDYYGNDCWANHLYKTKTKAAQEAHEAIRPTNINLDIRGKTEEEKNIYKLIYIRTLTSKMISAVTENTKIKFYRDGLPIFTTKGSRITKKGWLEANKFNEEKEVFLPELNEGMKFNCLEALKFKKETSPPNRYSEAGIIKEMERLGIGRPSTYASTIRTLMERRYIEKLNSSLKITDLGEVISLFLELNFSKYVESEFTAKMEENLDLIAVGKLSYKKTIEDFYFPFKKDVESKEGIEKINVLGNAEYKCHKCNSNMVYKLSKIGKFISCIKFPECMGARTNEGEIIKDPEELGVECPKCKKGKLIKIMGRFGVFVSCNNYPKCKYIQEDEEEKKKKDTGVNCTECETGTMIERKGKFGIFYSCTNYPNCKFAIKAKPTGNICKECGSLMMEGTKTIPTRCSNKKCLYHNPHKIKD